jgi:hypothetical protein
MLKDVMLLPSLRPWREWCARKKKKTQQIPRKLVFFGVEKTELTLM